MRKILVILGIFLWGGCALRTSHITYPTVKSIVGLSILEKGNNFKSCLLKQEKIASTYKIMKENLTVYIVLGNKYTPIIYLGAKDKNGNTLNIKMNNISQNDFFYSLSKSEHILDTKRIKKYALTKSYTTRVLFDEKLQKEIIDSFGPINLEIYNLKEEKIYDLKLEFDLKSLECRGIETI